MTRLHRQPGAEGMADSITAVVNDILGQHRGAGPLSRAEVLQLIDSGGSEGGAQVQHQL